jgi:DNA-directed RNA polymerase subunit beta'
MSLKDMIRPKIKDEIIAQAYKEVDKVDAQFQTGVITDGERHNKIIDIWTAATEKVSDELYKTIDRNVTETVSAPTETNPVYMMVDSKARVRNFRSSARRHARADGHPPAKSLSARSRASFREV